MEILNDTGLKLGWLVGRVRPPATSLTVIVKGTFTLAPNAPAALAAPGDRLLLEGDRHLDGDPGKSLVYASDFAYFKPRADVLLVGTCRTPRGEAQPVSYAALEVGRLRKRIAVIGDRIWDGEVATEPRPFRAMPLRYELSFGGDGFAKNPLGRGRGKVKTAAGVERWPLPNLELPGSLIDSPRQTPDPAGFGPIERTWAQRTAGVGTYDDRWLIERWPGLPEDFDWGYFNAAPHDQQIAGYLRGDEAIALENLHPELPRYESRLPGLRARCFVEAAARGRAEIREVPLHLDTLWIDMDAGRLALVWRGLTPIASRAHDELRRVLLVAEPLAEPPLPASRYRDPAWWRRPEAPEVAAKPRASGAPGAPDGEPGKPGDIDPDIIAGLEQARAMLEKSGVPRDVIERLRGVTSPDAFLAIVIGELRHDPEAAARLERDSREQTRRLLVEHGHDPALLDEPARPEDRPAAAAALTREEVAARAKGGRSFAGARLAGLDLSELDLRGLVFTRADLTGARLREARLDGADLTGARLERADLTRASLARAVAVQAELFGADLTGADLSAANLSEAGLRGAALPGARLDEADLTGATLAQANLERASLREAELGGANLAEVRARGANARGARLRGARLTAADLRGASLDAADLTGCALDGAQLGGASLREASLYGASGERVSMAEADLTGARAVDGASFRRVDLRAARADGSSWTGASLREADLRGATLIRADLSGADLSGANLHRAVLKNANLSKAKLDAALLTAVNLFQATLEQANLTRADLRGSNLYGCELLDAVLAEARLEGANLKATKLAGRSAG
ncbi:DUF2169 domain-containing protein [Sorangium sp. So ce296]|uniref:DUF2169 family type VI secretion system accessory protein n=1 Tax=Sorangium sp. So ce296 TaxID=3133296 RepID=UPI003F6354FA